MAIGWRGKRVHNGWRKNQVTGLSKSRYDLSNITRKCCELMSSVFLYPLYSWMFQSESSDPITNKFNQSSTR